MVSTTTGPSEPTSHDDSPADVAALSEDPRTDTEALCLCSLVWSPTASAAGVAEGLTGRDFVSPVYGELFALAATQVNEGRPHDPASIAAVVAERGNAGGAQRLGRALAGVITAGGAPEALNHYALAVANAAYRRSFHAAATSMTQAAGELPQGQLFPHLVEIGRAQRTATERLTALRTALG